VLLDGASFGPCCHAREGTLLEEGASAAHAVGTKQTILLPFATLGSNINFCDALLAGGSSAQDHSEIGSGFIHFNFTPHGPGGDKATPSLLGDVPRGVWLREKRIFLGGAGGVVGPAQIGYGTVLAAGSVWRRDRGEDLLALAERLPERELAFNPAHQSRPREKLVANARYLGNLCALRAFHRHVRMPLLRDDVARTAVVAAACALLEASIGERMKQLERWAAGLAEQGEPGRVRAALRTLRAQLADTAAPAPPTALTQAFANGAESSADGPVIAWLRSAPETAMAAGREWLAAIVESRVAAVRRATE
jgi:UDP-N-acetylglucosamine/UDP-N-acetylgalactosamine diphosphorylase